MWQDPTQAALLLRQQEALLKKKNTFQELGQQLQDCKELIEMAAEENLEELVQEQSQVLRSLCKKAEKIHIENLFTQPTDEKGCFVSLQAGAGGTEAQDWANMLMRMYMRWAERGGYSVELLDETPGEEAGIKSATLRISKGDFPYGWLKGETGVHRLVRISPFDSASRRHTSFASIWVSPELDDAIVIDIQDKDIRIDTYRASGAGGQHVNKTDSAVRITHLATGIVVQCQSDRSQHRNKATAMSMLQSKLYEKAEREQKNSIEQPDKQGICWGSQIRSYVLQPYQMVKDLRTGTEEGNTSAVLDGKIDEFLKSYLLLH